MATVVPSQMKLGACYNLFDCEELMETSLLSIRRSVQYIVVVYQTISNFGNQANPFLEKLLADLKTRGLVDELVLYKPRAFSPAEKAALISPNVKPDELGGSVAGVGDQFFNELSKRELGRQKCMENGCTHFFSLDADEYYRVDELEAAKRAILENNYDGTACWMRIFFKEPIYEYYPYDSVNCVPFIFKVDKAQPFRLAAPYPIVVDPTRRIEPVKNFHLFTRDVVEMFHMTFIRKDLHKKLLNVSNRVNYGTNIEEFLGRWDAWRGPTDGPLHPHPTISRFFDEVKVTENYFKIDLARQCRACSIAHDLFRCSRCKAVRYCSQTCQKHDWPEHRLECRPPQ